MGIRVADVKAQMKLAAVLGDSHPKTRIDEIQRDAEQHGVGPLPNSTKFTAMVKSELDAGSEYSFLSGLTHGSTTFIRQIGFELVSGEKENLAATKAVKPLVVEFALTKSFEWMARPIWIQASYLGRPHEDLRVVLNTAANDLIYPVGLRFWNDSEHFAHWTH